MHKSNNKNIYKIKGFTVAEIMIAVLIAGVALLPIISLFTKASQNVQAIQQRLYAISYARICMEKLLLCDYNYLKSLAAGGDNPFEGDDINKFVYEGQGAAIENARLEEQQYIDFCKRRGMVAVGTVKTIGRNFSNNREFLHVNVTVQYRARKSRDLQVSFDSFKAKK